MDKVEAMHASSALINGFILKNHSIFKAKMAIPKRMEVTS
jgi:hypothetical protein